MPQYQKNIQDKNPIETKREQSTQPQKVQRTFTKPANPSMFILARNKLDQVISFY